MYTATSRPLHLLFLWPRTFFSYISTYLTPSLLLNLFSNVTRVLRASMVTAYKMATLPLQHFLTLSPWFLFFYSMYYHLVYYLFTYLFIDVLSLSNIHARIASSVSADFICFIYTIFPVFDREQINDKISCFASYTVHVKFQFWKFWKAKPLFST